MSDLEFNITQGLLILAIVLLMVKPVVLILIAFGVIQ